MLKYRIPQIVTLTHRIPQIVTLTHNLGDLKYIKKENPISRILFRERKTGLKPATLSLEG